MRFWMRRGRWLRVFVPGAGTLVLGECALSDQQLTQVLTSVITTGLTTVVNNVINGLAGAAGG